MGAEDDLSKVSEIIQQSVIELKSIQVEKEIPLDIDLGNLLAVDNNEVDTSKFSKETVKDSYFRDLARDGVQCILNKVWDLPSETIDSMIYAVIPKPSTRVPREKPVPKQRQMTKWEEYAKAKGIKKKKKGNKLWDDVLKEWIPRYGYRKVAAEKQKNWVMEVPDGADPYEDQFEKASKDKNERIARNEFQRLRNIARNKNIKVPKLGVTSENMSGPKELSSALSQTRLSTASLGKFQRTLDKEKPLSETKKGQKRKLPANDTTSNAIGRERENALKLLSKMKTPEMDYETAVNKQIKADNIEMSHPDKKTHKRRSKQGGRTRGHSDRRAIAKGLKPTKKTNYKSTSKFKAGGPKGKMGGKGKGKGKTGGGGGGKKRGKATQASGKRGKRRNK